MGLLGALTIVSSTFIRSGFGVISTEMSQRETAGRVVGVLQDWRSCLSAGSTFGQGEASQAPRSCLSSCSTLAKTHKHAAGPEEVAGARQWEGLVGGARAGFGDPQLRGPQLSAAVAWTTSPGALEALSPASALRIPGLAQVHDSEGQKVHRSRCPVNPTECGNVEDTAGPIHPQPQESCWTLPRD